MAKKLTKKERGFVKDVVETGNATLAALKNYDIKAIDKENVAGSIGSENLTKPKIIKAIEDALPDDLLAERHLELLNKREKSIIEYDNEDVGGKKVYQVLDQPDTHAVSKGLDMAYKIKGSYKIGEGGGGVKVNVLIVDKGLAEKYGITPSPISDSN